MTIYTKNKAHKKIFSYAKSIGKDNEIGGLLLGKINPDGDITVKDAIILKQYKSGGSFELDDEAIGDFTKNADANLLQSVIGWWHSHGVFNTFWSNVDDMTFKRMCNLSNFCLGVVISLRGNKENSRWRLDIKDKNNIYVSIDNITPEIPQTYVNYFVDKKEIDEEVKSLVHDEINFYETCPTCRGSGHIFTPHKKKNNIKQIAYHNEDTLPQWYDKNKFYDEYDYIG